MPWSNKSKNSEASVGLKNEIQQESDTFYILTPDSDFILVGDPEDDELIWVGAYNNWSNKSEQAEGSWSLKSKN